MASQSPGLLVLAQVENTPLCIIKKRNVLHKEESITRKPFLVSKMRFSCNQTIYHNFKQQPNSVFVFLSNTQTDASKYEGWNSVNANSKWIHYVEKKS